jgi:DNA-binding transcriptional MerR regulator
MMGKLYTSGQAAHKLGVTRDALLAAVRQAGAPDARSRVGDRRAFSENDIAELAAWFERRL